VRRSLIGGTIVAAAAAAVGAGATAAFYPVTPTQCPPDTRGRTALRQVVSFEARPAEVYAALMTSQAFATFTGMAATIDPAVGGAFSIFGGLIVGRNIELAPDARIVQVWRAVEDFPSGIYSLVKMDLTPTMAGTQLVLDHTGFPEGHYDHLYEGWPPRYWLPLKRYLAARRAGTSS
jgi:activator of HSP90 ATPase